MKKGRKTTYEHRPTYESEPKKLTLRKFSDFFSLYYSNMIKITGANLLFAVPMLALILLFRLLANQISDFALYNVVILIPAFFGYILYMGVSAVTLKITEKEKRFSVFKTFISGAASSLSKSLIQAVAVYLAVNICVFSFTFYYSMASYKSSYFIFMVFYAVFVYLLVFILMNLPFLVLKHKCGAFEAFKISGFMLVKNARANFLVGTIFTLIFALCTFLINAVSGKLYLTLLVIFALLLIFPAFISLMVSFYSYDAAAVILTDEPSKSHTSDKVYYTNPVKKNNGASKSAASVDEYVFYNGKMIRRDKLEAELSAAEKLKEGKPDEPKN